MPVRLVDIGAGLTAEAVYAATGFALSSESDSEPNGRSRRAALEVVLTCIKCAVPLVLEGPAGVGKTKLVEVAYQLLAGGVDDGKRGGEQDRDLERRRRLPKVPTVQFSKSTTLQDVVGQWRPVGDTCVWVDGPLAMRGATLLCDEMNLAPSDVSFLVPLLDAPSVFDCPFGGGRVQVAPGFVIVAAQNPPHYAGRTALPRAFVRRALCFTVRPYLESEVIEILSRRVASEAPLQDLQPHSTKGILTAESATTDRMRPQLRFLVRLLGYTDAAVAEAASDGVTLRHVLKLLGRLLKPDAWRTFGGDDDESAEEPAWRRIATLHASIVFPELLTPDRRLVRLEASLSVVDDMATFALSSGGQSACVRLRLVSGSSIASEFDALPWSGRVLLCKLAFCVASREPVLLCGPSSFKSHCVELLGRSLRFEKTCTPSGTATSSAVNTIYLSPLTEAGDLEGSIEPHSRGSFLEYLHGCCEQLQPQSNLLDLGPQSTPLASEAAAAATGGRFDGVAIRLLGISQADAQPLGNQRSTRVGLRRRCASSTPWRSAGRQRSNEQRQGFLLTWRDAVRTLRRRALPKGLRAA